MLKDIKNTAKHSIVYAIGNMGVKIVGFLLIPLYTNPEILSTSDYGALAVLEATLQVLVGVLSFAMTGSLARWFWDKTYEAEQKSIFFTSISFLTVVIIPIVFFLSYFSEQLSRTLFESIEYSLLLNLTIITAGFQIINNLVLTLLRLKSKSVLTVSIQIAKFVTLLFLIIWNLKYKGTGLIGIWQAYFIIEVIVFIVLIPVIAKNSIIKIQLKILKEMLAYGLPLMLASLSGVLLSVTDRYMLNSMEGLDRTAVYSIGYRIANTLKIVVTSSLGLALLPLKMKKIGEEESERFYAKVMKYSSFLFSIALLCLSLFSLEILKVITGSTVYWEAHGIVAVISFALLFGHLKEDALIGITIKKRTKITGTLVFIASILNIGLNIVLIPLWDIYGAALATLLSQIFFFITVYITAQKIYYIPYELRNTIVLVMLLAVFVIIGLAVSDLDIFIRLIIKIILLILYPILLSLLNYYNETEKEIIKQLFYTWRKPGKLKENFKRFLK